MPTILDKEVDRRAAIKCLAGAASAGAIGIGTVAASGGEPAASAGTGAIAGMLYDATRCIGCKACVVACREANGMKPDRSGHPEGLYDAPADLGSGTRNIIKLYKEGSTYSYMKTQCMHCIDPACAAACMIGALAKREFGAVTWKGEFCVGCRYCQMACPFNIPKFEWEAVNPRIVKCELCSHRLVKGGIPACVEVCPRQAVVFGTREQLLNDARQRLAESPGRYIPKIYGEHDAGGTQVLYLSAVPFEKLGLPDLGERPAPQLAETVQHGVYRGFIAPAALYALLGIAVFRNRRAAAAETGASQEKKT